MNSESKLRQQEEQLHGVESRQQEAAAEFSNAEEVLRHDAAQVEVPRAVAERLNESIANEPKPAKSWWKRFVAGE
jgi:hypothetical protein